MGWFTENRRNQTTLGIGWECGERRIVEEKEWKMGRERHGDRVIPLPMQCSGMGIMLFVVVTVWE